jgi:hypothetical protein
MKNLSLLKNLYGNLRIIIDKELISIWLNITGDNAKENFDKLYDIAFEQSKNEVSPDIIWDRMEGRKMSSVILKTNGDLNKKADWEKQYTWFKVYIEKFILFFKPIVKKI